jgi:hypothetical protein
MAVTLFFFEIYLGFLSGIQINLYPFPDGPALIKKVKDQPAFLHLWEN